MSASPITAILFDLDGTLVPMDQNEFIDAYFGALVRKVTPLGFEKEPFLASMWKGTGAMIKNDGSRLNSDAFWSTFSAIWGEQIAILEPCLNEFYSKDFDAAARVVVKHPIPPVRALIDALRRRGLTLCLATNPLFPRDAVATRLSWAGLSPADFVHVTTYENSSYCKPSPGYYEETLAAIGKAPEECIMIGNNPVDDMSALSLGLSGFLLTDCLENETGVDISPYPNGDFAALIRFLEDKLGGKVL